MKNIDSKGHVRGESIYLDDIPVLEGTLFLSVFDSPVAHGKLNSVDITKAEQLPGVKRIILANDIPGENQIGGIVPDEPLLAENDVHFMGMPIALVVAESEEIARKAVHLISADIEPLPVITDPRVAAEKHHLIVPPRTFEIGDTTSVWKECEYIFEGRADSGGQEHLYIETNGAYTVPVEHGGFKVFSSTQGPTSVQRMVARVLGLPMHKVEIDVTRLGGGFGGKEDQATPWAVMTSLAAKLLNRPVKFSVHRMEDMRITGKRHPYSSDFKIGLSKDYKILAYETTFYQNAGSAADLSPAVMERTLFHSTNSYFVPNVKATAYSCKTNLPPNTAFRGFGGPQGMFVIEAAIAKAAHSLRIDRDIIQKANLLQDGNMFPYGQIAKETLSRQTWSKAEELYNLTRIKEDIHQFNNTNTVLKKGVSVMPVCFGISFTKLHMNQARALVHIYSDGSVGISTGAIEMGQGVNTKMVQVAKHVFGIAPNLVKIETTNTTRVANTSPSAASSTADLNGKAVEIACNRLKERLLALASTELNLPFDQLSLNEGFVCYQQQKTSLDWFKLVEAGFFNRVCLSENGHYATPVIHFDTTIEKGHPFAYHVYGTAITVVTVDCLRGTYTFDAVHIVHDFGKSMNKDIDLGQIEGGLVQGIGWMTMEELIYNDQGRLLSNALSTYKVPDIYSVPQEINVDFLEAEGSDLAILKSKAVGEPPLMYGIGAFFAIQNAIDAFQPNHTLNLSSPMTPEKVLLSLYETQ